MALLHPGIEIPFTHGFYTSRSLQQSAQECINYRPAIHKVPTLSPASLYMTGGIKDAVDNLDGVCRGAHEMDGKPYVVSGERLYRIDETVESDGTFTYAAVELGTIPASTRVIMASGKGPAQGEFSLAIVAGESATTSAFTYSTTEVASFVGLDNISNFLDPVIDVININGFFTFLNTQNEVFHSNLNDIRTYNALDKTTINETNRTKGLLAYRGKMFVFGDEEILPFVYIGGAQFVFTPQPEARKPYGLRGLHAKADIGRYMAFLGKRRNAEPSIYVYTGAEPVEISTEVIDFELQRLTEIELDNAFIETYSQGGGDFVYILAGNKCFVYNFKTSLWHEQRSYTNGKQNRWRANAICQAYNKLIVGDGVGNKVGILDSRETTEFGEEIHRSFTTQAFDNKGKALLVKQARLMMDAGFDGDMTLTWSDDGGFTWASALTKSAGPVGDYGRLVHWDSMGSTSFSRVLRFGTSTTAQCHVNKLFADA